MTSRGLDVIETEGCYELLRRQSFGRVGMKLADDPIILPVYYACFDDAIVFRTDPGTKLIAAVLETRVAFEVDDVEVGWSVLAIGRAHEVRSASPDMTGAAATTTTGRRASANASSGSTSSGSPVGACGDPVETNPRRGDCEGTSWTSDAHRGVR